MDMNPDATTRRTVLRSISAGCALVVSGCTTLAGNETDLDADDTADCSDAKITSIRVTASTSGDHVVVKGNVFDLPAPSLKGYVVHLDGERVKDSITKRLETTGAFTESFRYTHHGIDEYEFWLEGCATTS